MKLSEITEIKVGNKTVVDIKLKGRVVWPTNYTYTLTELQVYQWSTTDSYFLANGSNYCTLRAKYNTYQSGVLKSWTWVFVTPNLSDTTNFFFTDNKLKARGRGTNINNTISGDIRYINLTGSYNGLTTSTSLQLYQASNIPTTSQSTSISDSDFGISASQYANSEYPCPAGGGFAYINKNYSSSEDYGTRTTTTITTYNYPSGSTYTSPTTVTAALSANLIYFRYKMGSNSFLNGNTLRFYSREKVTSSAQNTAVIEYYTDYTIGGEITLYQQQNTYSDSQKIYTLTAFEHSNFVNSGMQTAKANQDSCSVICNAKETYTRTWLSGATEQVDGESITPTITALGTGLRYVNGTATWEARSKETTSRTGTLTAKYLESTLGSLTLEQAAVIKVYSLSLSTDKSSLSAGGDSAQLTAIGTIEYDSGVASDISTVINWTCIDTGSRVSGKFNVTSAGLVSVSSLLKTETEGTNNGVFSTTWNSITKSITLYQAQNIKNLSSSEITLKLNGIQGNIIITSSAQEIELINLVTINYEYTSGSVATGNSTASIALNNVNFSLGANVISVTANSSYLTRVCTVTASYDGTTSKEYSITQEEADYIIVSPSAQSNISLFGGSFNLNIQSNINWSIVNTSGGWLSFSKTTGSGNDTVIVTIAENSYTARSASITVRNSLGVISDTCEVGQDSGYWDIPSSLISVNGINNTIFSITVPDSWFMMVSGFAIQLTPARGSTKGSISITASGLGSIAENGYIYLTDINGITKVTRPYSYTP